MVENLTLDATKIYGLVGPNGAGKTTLMKSLCGLLVADSASIFLDDLPLDLSDRQLLKKIGTNFSDMTSLNDLTLIEIYRDHLFYYDIENAISLERLLDDVKLTVNPDLKFGKMSLGMKQRFLLGLTFLHQPDIVILDEPFNGLDPDGVVLFINIIKSFLEDRIILISSHQLSELESFVDEVIFIDNGKTKNTSSIDTIKSSYQGGLKAYYAEQKLI
jgi:ABC-2 type transport system ATP-binding protein